ncbi:phosphodiester glycosidase family protein [uncultured Psychroserpens sp.]|uniref:phosphodiester glycosidase family protein n=1 Tax=uncultured Psychroserpens sp. TaxID=255436 RepID=UPI002623224B|nr:phosphodiester glycosidase family protein [uncultured Psychroserpens sp.]
MKHLIVAIILMLMTSCTSSAQQIDDDRFISHVVDLKTQTLKFYLKDSLGNNYSNFLNLKTSLEHDNQSLIFAMNGGMYLRDGSPQGLYIENGITKTPLDTLNKLKTNFYLKPNGVFYLTNDNKGAVCQTSEYKASSTITYATQSGPMLVINDSIHPIFKKDSKHFNVRNGVGVLPNGNLIFAMSKDTITLYDFADFFKTQGCKNALYLDGFVSRTYLPKKKWVQLDGNFGVIIAETKHMN